MPSPQHRIAVLAVVLPVMAMAAPRSASAFQVGQSPDFGACNIWFNDQGQPLRNKQGREIGQAVPCQGQEGRHDTYSVTPGPSKNTLIIRDETHRLQCVLALAPGSTTIVIPTGCKAFGG